MGGKDVKIKRQLNQKCSKSKKKKERKTQWASPEKKCNTSVKDIKRNFQGGRVKVIGARGG